MKNLKSIIAVLLTLIAGIFIFGCLGNSDGKIPITTSSKDALELYQKGVKYTNNARSREALKYYEKALAADSNFAMAILHIATSKDNAFSVAEALPRLKELYPNLSKGEQLMIDALEAGLSNDNNDVLNYHLEIAKLYPKDENARMMVASNYYGQQEYDKAIDEYKKAVEINENFAPAYNMLGYCYRSVNNYSEAEKYFKKYIELIPNDPNPYDSYAELLMKMGRFEESITNYQKALSIDPYFSFSYVGIASDLNFLDRHIEARNQLQEMFETAKSNMLKQQALFATAISYIDERNYESAFNTFEKSRTMNLENGDNVAAYQDMMNRTYLYLMLKDTKNAKSSLNETEEFISQGELTDAVKNTVNRVILYSRCWLAAEKGDLDNADTLAQRYDLIAKDADNANLIRSSNTLQGMIAEAREEYDIAVEHYRLSNLENPMNFFRLAGVYEKMGQTEQAAAFYKKAAFANDNNNFGYAFVRLNSKEKVEQLTPVS